MKNLKIKFHFRGYIDALTKESVKTFAFSYFYADDSCFSSFHWIGDMIITYYFENWFFVAVVNSLRDFILYILECMFICSVIVNGLSP